MAGISAGLSAPTQSILLNSFSGGQPPLTSSVLSPQGSVPELGAGNFPALSQTMGTTTIQNSANYQQILRRLQAQQTQPQPTEFTVNTSTLQNTSTHK